MPGGFQTRHNLDATVGLGFRFAPQAQAILERRWRHIKHLLFECPGISGLGGSPAVILLLNDLLRTCFGSDPAQAVLLAVFPTARTTLVAATACVVPFLLDRTAALGRHPPWYMKVCLPRRCSLRLLLFCTCPPLCARAPWPMPAWVWRHLFFTSSVLHQVMKHPEWEWWDTSACSGSAQWRVPRGFCVRRVQSIFSKRTSKRWCCCRTG